jgi:hypothetical protein
MRSCSHGNLRSRAGDLDFGAQAGIDEIEPVLRWYDCALKGATNGFEIEKPTKLFVMGTSAVTQNRPTETLSGTLTQGTRH